MNPEMTKCFDDLKRSKKTVALTGAGVSTLSGIPDFRGPNGVFTRRAEWNGYPIEALHDTDFITAHPDVYYAYAKEAHYPMTEAEPSIAHTTLAKMEKEGLLSCLYTQNIDTLHTKAGSQHVEELHGSFRGHHCTGCGKRFGLEPIRSQVMKGEVPHCSSCGSLIKSDVVMFGDPLDSAMLDRAFQDFSEAECLIVMGSSLTVAPVSSLPGITLRHGGKLIIVNDGETSYDHHAAYRFHDIAEFCCGLAQYFRWQAD